MKEEKAKVSVEQIYRSRLTEKCVTYDDGWMHWEAPREPEPTGYPEMDALGKLLATTPVPSVQAVTVAMGMPASRDGDAGFYFTCFRAGIYGDDRDEAYRPLPSVGR